MKLFELLVEDWFDTPEREAENLRLVNQDGHNLRNIMMPSEAVQLAAIKQNPWAVTHIGVHNLTKEMIDIASKDPAVAKFIDQYRTAPKPTKPKPDRTHLNSTSPNEIQNLIKQQCKPFLDTGVELFRVSNVDIGIHGGLVKTVANRKPIDTNAKIHRLIDKYFLNHYGHKWRSDHIIFCLGSYYDAEEYQSEHGLPGNIVKIYPVGQFKYLFNRYIDDMYLALGEMGIDVDEGLLDDETPLTYKYIEQALNSINKWQSTGIKDWAKLYGSSELMVNCQSYYAVPAKPEK